MKEVEQTVATSGRLRNVMLELLATDGRIDGDQAELVSALHDAIVLTARIREEFTEHDRPEWERIKRDVARRRVLAHALSDALSAVRSFDERYPR